MTTATITAPNLKTVTKILHKLVGYNYEPELYDEVGPAKIHYTATETVERGSVCATWGMTTTERDERIDNTATANTVADMLHLLRTLEDEVEGASIQYVELSDEMAAELTTMWTTMFGDAEVHVRHGFSPLV